MSGEAQSHFTWYQDYSRSGMWLFSRVCFPCRLCGVVRKGSQEERQGRRESEAGGVLGGRTGLPALVFVIE